jgi:XTP/dITP diphosphohydrolase
MSSASAASNDRLRAGELRKLVLGTHNVKKRRELDFLLRPHGFELRTLEDFPNSIEVEEDGSTFGENATKKAVQQAVHLNAWVLGEDSGIAVDALDGAPGIYSARFSGPEATDESNNELLLEKLKGLSREKRTAHYVCHMTLSDPTGVVHIDCESTCRGVLRTEPSGSGGFGYDPLFEIPEYGLTFGELGPDIKGVLSHRARASRLFLPKLLKLLATLP